MLQFKEADPKIILSMLTTYIENREHKTAEKPVNTLPPNKGSMQHISVTAEYISQLNAPFALILQLSPYTAGPKVTAADFYPIQKEGGKWRHRRERAEPDHTHTKHCTEQSLKPKHLSCKYAPGAEYRAGINGNRNGTD